MQTSHFWSLYNHLITRSLLFAYQLYNYAFFLVIVYYVLAFFTVIQVILKII